MAKVHIILITVLLLASIAEPSLDSAIYSLCSPITFAPDSAFSAALTSLLTALANSASTSTYNQVNQDGSVQGLFQCQGDVPPGPACSSCVSRAASSITTVCSYATAAILQLQGCYLKYSARPFAGVEDTTLVFKRCGAADGPGSLGPDRESVLNGLVSGPGGGERYREVRSGSVRGMTQCLGDLSVDQCTDCVDQAAGLLRTDCASAPYGDVFFVTCYARFATDHGIKIRSIKTTLIIAAFVLAALILLLLIIFLYTKFGPGKRTATHSAPAPAPASPAPDSAIDASPNAD